MNEIWMEYKTTENFRWGTVKWEVSNYGNVKKNGELYECGLNGCYKCFAGDLLHRVVAKLFIPNPEDKPEVDHIDANTLNNNVSNLRWCTRKENQNNPKTRHCNSENHADFSGKNNPRAKKCILDNKTFGCIKDAITYGKTIGLNARECREMLEIIYN